MGVTEDSSTSSWLRTSPFWCGHGRDNLSLNPLVTRDPMWVVVKIVVPFLGTLNIRCRIIIRTQKGTIILTTIHVLEPGSFFCSNRCYVFLGEQTSMSVALRRTDPKPAERIHLGSCPAPHPLTVCNSDRGFGVSGSGLYIKTLEILSNCL